MRPAPQCGAERTGRVDRTVVDRDAHDVDQTEGEADSQAGKLAEAFARVGCAENHEDEEERQQAFCHEGHRLIGAGLHGVSGKRSVARDAAEIKIGSHIDKPVEESGADGCADELRDDVAAEFTEFHATRQQHCKRYGRVDMTARDIADAIYKTQ